MLKKIVCSGLCLLLVTGLMMSEASASLSKRPEHMTAQYFLRALPAEIFDQTELPLSENEKNYLAEVGHVNQWVIRQNTPDLLIVSSTTPEKNEMRIKVFRDDHGGGMIVVGTESSLPCMAQFWKFDKHGSILPVDEDPLVEVSDYFITMSYLPPSIGFSVTFCLHEDSTVEALPSFWNISGLLDIPMEKRVFLVWKNGDFEKSVVYRSILLTPEEEE